MNKNKLVLLFLLAVMFIINACQNSDTPVSTTNNTTTDINYYTLLSELNYARTQPKAYAAILQARRQYYKGNLYSPPGAIPLQTQEGVAALDEAVAALNQQAPVGALSIATGLNKSAQDHVNDQGPKGALGHNGSDGSTPGVRMLRYGTFPQGEYWGENIAYGPTTAREIVAQLIIDDGVADRGHRTNIYHSGYTQVGFGWGTHNSQYKFEVVQDFARGYVSN